QPCERLLTVAIVVMPPTAVRVAIKSATNTDITVGLHFTKALSVIHSRCTHRARTFGNLLPLWLVALGKHLGSLIPGNGILLENIIRNVINVYLVTFTGRRSHNRHGQISFLVVSVRKRLGGLSIPPVIELRAFLESVLNSAFMVLNLAASKRRDDKARMRMRSTRMFNPWQ